MTEKAPGDKGEGFEEQLREMMRKANVSFFMGPVQGPAEADDKADAKQPEKEPGRLKIVREFKLKPREIRDHLDRFVIGQDDAKQALSVAICDHYNHVRRCLEDPAFSEREYSKHNIILLGPSGVGKTYLMRCIAKLIGVPFIKSDATKFTETGYVGHDAEDLVRDLVKAANDDIDLAQYGIIYMDEIDKIAAQPTAAGRDVSGRGVQVNLLKLMEETDVGLFSQTDILGQIQAVMDMQRGKAMGKRTINTKHILFIVSGAFDRLAEQVQRRLGSGKIGFEPGRPGEAKEGDFLRRVETRDFIDYGFEPEFIGRLPIRVVCDALSAEDLEAIMVRSEGSVLEQYRNDFAGYGIEMNVTPEAIRAVAQRAHTEKTGARGLMTVLERMLRRFKFELPSTAVRSFTVDRKTVEDSEAALKQVLRHPKTAPPESALAEVTAFVERFRKEHGLGLAFNKAAVERLVQLSQGGGKSVKEICEERFRDCEYGLELISRNTGATEFTVTRTFVDGPAAEISRRIARSYVKKSDAGA